MELISILLLNLIALALYKLRNKIIRKKEDNRELELAQKLLQLEQRIDAAPTAAQKMALLAERELVKKEFEGDAPIVKGDPPQAEVIDLSSRRSLTRKQE